MAKILINSVGEITIVMEFDNGWSIQFYVFPSGDVSIIDIPMSVARGSYADVSKYMHNRVRLLGPGRTRELAFTTDETLCKYAAEVAARAPINEAFDASRLADAVIEKARKEGK